MRAFFDPVLSDCIYERHVTYDTTQCKRMHTKPTDPITPSDIYGRLASAHWQSVGGSPNGPTLSYFYKEIALAWMNMNPRYPPNMQMPT